MSTTTCALAEPILRETESHRARSSGRTLACLSFVMGFVLVLSGQCSAVWEPAVNMMIALRAWRGHLDMHEQGISEIQPGAFKDLTLRGKLDLHENKIRSITGAFDGLNLLGDLDLHENKLKVIRAGDLKQLSLHGSLEKLGENEKRGAVTPERTSLNLHENRIVEIEPGAFQGLSLHGSLDLSANKITVIKAGTFKGLSLQGSLDLSSNKLMEVLPGAFSGLSCDCVDLAGNGLKEIGSAAFRGIGVKHLKVIVDANVNATDLAQPQHKAKTVRHWLWKSTQAAQPLEDIQVVRDGSC